MIPALAHQPLGGLKLEHPFGHVVAHGVAEDVRRGVLLGNVTAAPAHHGHQLGLIVQFGRLLGEGDILLMGGDGIAKFGKQHRLIRLVHGDFRRVIPIVEAHA